MSSYQPQFALSSNKKSCIVVCLTPPLLLEKDTKFILKLCLLCLLYIYFVTFIHLHTQTHLLSFESHSSDHFSYPNIRLCFQCYSITVTPLWPLKSASRSQTDEHVVRDRLMETGEALSRPSVTPTCKQWSETDHRECVEPFVCVRWNETKNVCSGKLI